MGIRGAVERLGRAFLATFAAMIVAIPVSTLLFARVPRARAIPTVYVFFAANLVGFAALLRGADGAAWAPLAFFVWVSVYNLFVTSVFCSSSSSSWPIPP